MLSLHVIYKILGLSLVLALRAVETAPKGVPPPNPPAWVGDERKS
jgi:hypothetical protein